MNFEYKGFKYGLSFYAGVFCYYSEKMTRRNVPQKPLRAKTLTAAQKEVNKIIDEQLKK